MIQLIINNSLENLGHNQDNRDRSIIRRITPTSCFLKKGVTLALFYSSGKIPVSIDWLNIRASDQEIKSRHSFRSLADTESRPVAFQFTILLTSLILQSRLSSALKIKDEIVMLQSGEWFWIFNPRLTIPSAISRGSEVLTSFVPTWRITSVGFNWE